MNIFSVDCFEQGNIMGTLITLNTGKPHLAVVVTAVQEEPRESLKDVLDTAFIRNGDRFSEPNVRKTLSDLGLNWLKYKSEYEKTGSLGKGSLAELESKNIPEFVMSEFLEWYDSKTKVTT
jgi:hypothetical protein